MSIIIKRTIQKVALGKGRTLVIHLKEHLDDGTFRDNQIKCDQLYHADVEIAFNKLKPFFVKICDQKEGDYIEGVNDFENEVLEKIEISAISVSGSADAEGVVISGTKHIGDKILKFDSPMTEFDGDYENGSELAEVIESIRFEAGEYLFGGKYLVKQLELPFDEKDENDIDKETSDVAREVFSNIGDSIITNTKKDKKKGKLSHMSIVENITSEAM